jgi:P63C domain
VTDLFGNPEPETPQSKGGKSRAARLSPGARQEIARKAALARWGDEDERLAPGLLTELHRLNPSDGQGHRKHRHHQYLSDDHGDPRLRDHLDKVTFLMKAASTWNQFKLLLDRAMPKINATGLLPLPDPE